MSIYPDSIESDVATLFEDSVAIAGTDYVAGVSDLAKGHDLESAGFMADNGIRVLMKASLWPNGAPDLNVKLTWNGGTYRIKTSRKDAVCVYLTCVDVSK